MFNPVRLSILALATLFSVSTAPANELDKLGDLAEFTLRLDGITIWADGDIIESYGTRNSFVNRLGNAFQETSTHPDPLVLIRPTILIGEPLESEGWLALRGEIGTDGRSEIKYHRGSSRAGWAVFAGVGNVHFAVANGHTQNPLYAPMDHFRSVFAPSYLDGTYTNRHTRPINGNSLDPSRVWSLMTEQLLDDSFTGGEIRHETVAARYETELGGFGLLADFSGHAYQLSYDYTGDDVQLKADVGRISGVTDRWGNSVDDWLADFRLARQIDERTTIDGGVLGTFGETRAHSNWGPGSSEWFVGASLEVVENHHARLEFRRRNLNQTNSAAVKNEDLRQNTLAASYGVQFSRNLYAEAQMALTREKSQFGQSSTIENFSIATGFKF